MKGFIIATLFGAINAVTCRLFIVPNSFASAGVEGIAIMIQKVSDFNLAYVQLAFNIPLCVFAFFCVGKLFAVNTVIYSLVYSLFYFLSDRIGGEYETGYYRYPGVYRKGDEKEVKSRVSFVYEP